MLPSVARMEDFRALRRDPSALLPGARAVAERHGLPASELEPFLRGTHFAFGTSRHVIKLFVPLWPEDALVETRLLAHLTGAGLPTPQLEAEGELDGWRHVVMSRVHGARLGDVWPALGPERRERVMVSLGELVARLGALPAAGLEDRAITQEALLAERLPRLQADQRERGGSDELVARLGAFAKALPALPDAPAALLHADLTDDHVLLDGDRISGLIDFADAFVGPWTYELAAPACFTLRGDGRSRRAFLAGLGQDDDAGLARAVRAWSVLHRYAHVAIMMSRAGHSDLDRWLDDVWPSTS